MDDWGWERLRPWLGQRTAMPIGPLFCVIDGPTCGRPWAAPAVRIQLSRLAAEAGVRRRFAPTSCVMPTPWRGPAKGCRST